MRSVSTFLIALVLMIGCDDSGAAPDCVGDAGAAPDCVATADVQLVFYENVCVKTWVQCDGEVQDRVDGDRGGMFCDLMNIRCDGPDRDESAVLQYVPKQRSCELCTEADDDTRCTPLPAGCGMHAVEHVASGSAETGPMTQPGDQYPFGNCDAGVGSDDGGL